MTQKIELLKVRDFSEIITDTFIFTRENLKPLLKCFFIFCGIFIVGGAILSVIQQSKVVHAINENVYPSSSPFHFFSSRYSFFGAEFFLNIILEMLNYTVMTVVLYSYMSLYKQKGNIPPTPEEVWGYLKYFYLKILGSGILMTVLIIAGTLLCFIPGIYLYPVLSLVFPIIIFENTSLGYAFNRSFRLIKNNWWPTFGTILIIGIIVYFAVMLILLPTTILNVTSLLLHPGKGMHISSIATITASILQHLCQVFYIVPLITIGLCYFNLTEKLDSLGLIDRINQLGDNAADPGLTTEEY